MVISNWLGLWNVFVWGLVGEGAVWDGAGEGCRDHAKKQPGWVRSCDVIIGHLHLELNTECCISKDSKGFPKNITNNRGEKRYPDSKDLTILLKTYDASFLDFLRRCLVWVCQGVFDSGVSSSIRSFPTHLRVKVWEAVMTAQWTWTLELQGLQGASPSVAWSDCIHPPIVLCDLWGRGLWDAEAEAQRD